MIFVTDGQTIGETLSTVFSAIQQGPINMAVVLKNSGVNTLNYDFQQYVNGAWQDIGASGSVFNTTLQPGQVAQIQVVSAYPQVQLIANASGGAFIDFAITRYANRPAGGAIPILTL